MFEILNLLGPSGSSIALQTRLGNDIENKQGCVDSDKPSAIQVRLFLRTHSGHFEPRKPPSPIYNCFGHVWASRRTWITEAPAIELILQDDSYRQLHSGEEPVPGDLVLYRDHRDIVVHAGEVIEYSAGIQGVTHAVVRPAKYARVLSKMGVYGEGTHRADYQDFLLCYRDVTFEYWTERPA